MVISQATRRGATYRRPASIQATLHKAQNKVNELLRCGCRNRSAIEGLATGAPRMSATPPLLMLAEGRKPRLRKAPQDRPKEIVLHIAVAKLLRQHARPDWQWTHIPNGEARDARTAAKLKQMGTRKGWPDFVLVPPAGQIRCLGLKRLGERLTDEQAEFRSWCFRNGAPHVVAYSLDEALVAFREWNCLQPIDGERQ